jgi:hypothetical protein
MIALALAGLASAACSTTQQNAAVLDTQSTPAATGTPSATLPAPDTPAFGGAASADAALSGWLTALVKADYPAACKMMGQKGANGGAPTAPTQAFCATLSSDKTAQNLLAGLHRSFTPAGAKPASTAVKVNGLAATGPTVTAADTQVKVDGKLLRDVIIANSKGLPAGKSVASFQVSHIGVLWYVTDFAIKS